MLVPTTATPLKLSSNWIILWCSSSAQERMSVLAAQIDVGFTKGVLSWTISGFLTCTAKACKCVASRFRRIGIVPSCGKLKRLSCESSSGHDFRPSGFKRTLPSKSTTRIAPDPSSETKTIPLVKQRFLASLNVSLRCVRVHQLVDANVIPRDESL